MAPPCSAICCSSAASQAGRRRVVGEQLVARAHRRFVARRMCAHGRARAPGPAGRGSGGDRPPARNRRSIAGVSHRTDSHSHSELTEAGAPLIRTWRRSGAAACVPVPISYVAQPGRDREPARPVLRAMSAERRPRSPRPGLSSDTASSMLVLPAPFSPDSRTKPRPRLDQRRRIGCGSRSG